MPKQTPRLMTCDVAGLAGVSVRSVIYWSDRGLLNPDRLETRQRERRFAPAEVLRFLDANKFPVSVEMRLTLSSGGPMEVIRVFRKRRAMARSRQPWMTCGDVAAAAKVCSASVRKWANKGLIHCVRLPGGGHRRFDPVDVAALLDSLGYKLPPELRKLLSPRSAG